MRRSVGAAVAVTAALLLMAAPAQAAPAAGAIGRGAARTTVSPEEVEANNAEVWASLPPNVTMTVLGEMPELRGPIDHYTQDGSTTTTGTNARAVATVPFPFTF